MSASRPAQNTTVNNNKSSRSPVIPINRLIPCCGLLCCINSFVCQQPECGGCYFRDICCCIQHEVFCCKGTTESGYDCVCYRMECMKGSCQDCCQVSYIIIINYIVLELLTRALLLLDGTAMPLL